MGDFGTFVRGGRKRRAATPAQAVKLKHEGWLKVTEPDFSAVAKKIDQQADRAGAAASKAFAAAVVVPVEAEDDDEEDSSS